MNKLFVSLLNLDTDASVWLLGREESISHIHFMLITFNFPELCFSGLLSAQVFTKHFAIHTVGKVKRTRKGFTVSQCSFTQ